MRALACGLAMVSICNTAYSEPTITRAESNGSLATLAGENFGTRCADCEVVADFGGFRYSLPIHGWLADQITVQLVDIGKGNEASLSVHSADGTSNAVQLALPEKLVPSERLTKTVSPDEKGELQVFTRSYDLSVGGKGTDSFDVSQPPATCGTTARVFDSAEIVLGRRMRFGDARKIESPPRGCASCSPVKVRYYFEPTGKLEYQLHVYRREVEGICSERVRP